MRFDPTITLAICLVFSLFGCSKSKPTGETKPNPESTGGNNNDKNAGTESALKDKIVGTWQLVKNGSGNQMLGETSNEYKKDGKLAITQVRQGRGPDGRMNEQKQVLEGTYSLDGDNLTHRLISGGNISAGKEITGVLKIKTLTDQVLVVEVREGQKVFTMEYKKK